jgi:hypothetical protein
VVKAAIMPRTSVLFLSLSLSLSLVGCGGSDDTTTPEPEAKTIPSAVTLAAFESFISGTDYTENGWLAESAAPREASNGVSPHGRVRVWFNPTAVESIAAGNGANAMAPPHTAETMVVKELYEADTLVGHAISLKYYCKGPAGRCYTGSAALTTPLFAKGDLSCGSCHGGFVFTPAP